MLTVISFTIDNRIKAVLQRLADADNRNLSNYILNLILKHIQEQGIDWKKEQVDKWPLTEGAMDWIKTSFDDICSRLIIGFLARYMDSWPVIIRADYVMVVRIPCGLLHSFLGSSHKCMRKWIMQEGIYFLISIDRHNCWARSNR